MVRFTLQLLLLTTLLLNYFTCSALSASSRMRADSTSSGRTRTVSNASSQGCSPRADDGDWALALELSDNINDASNYLRQTPLMLACLHHAGLSIIQQLLQEGADPLTQDILYNTVLHYACEGGDISVVELLLAEYNVPIKYSLSKGFPGEKTSNTAIQTLVQFHKDERARRHMETVADAAFVEITQDDVAGMPSVPEEEDFELVEASDGTDD